MTRCVFLACRIEQGEDLWNPATQGVDSNKLVHLPGPSRLTNWRVSLFAFLAFPKCPVLLLLQNKPVPSYPRRVSRNFRNHFLFLFSFKYPQTKPSETTQTLAKDGQDQDRAGRRPRQPRLPREARQAPRDRRRHPHFTGRETPTTLTKNQKSSQN